jgi:hypothetical protein
LNQNRTKYLCAHYFVFVNVIINTKLKNNSLLNTKTEISFLASSTINDMFTHFEQLGYRDFYTLVKLSVILPHGVCKITRKF